MLQVKKKIEKYDKEIQLNGGANSGWDDADHKDFLRIKTKHNNKLGTIAF